MKKINTLNFQQAKHLVERTGYGVELDVIESYVGQSLDAVVNQITTKPSIVTATPKLLTPSEYRQLQKKYRLEGRRKEFKKIYRREKASIKSWGLENLLTSENPFHERMTWFWHNHFTSSVQSVRPMWWMLQQDLSMRKHGLGRFSDLLKTLSFDPAMLIYLDGKSNKKGQANENFARELLELFTLGEGNYTETDIKEAARAFTGWRLQNKKNRAVFVKKLHDDGVKTFMGQQGKFTGQDILNILLQNPRTSEFIAEKLWYEFISTKPPEQKVIRSWAKSFRNSHYDIASLLKNIFLSDSFWDKKYQGTLIKSPLDLVVGSLRTFNLEDNNFEMKPFLRQLKLMGQDLYLPPNVKGWEGGKAWINDDSLLRRQRFLQRIMRGQAGAANKKERMLKMQNTSADNNMMSKMNKRDRGMNAGEYELPELSNQQWAQWLLPIPPITPIDNLSNKARLRSIVLDPAYQLK